MSIPCYNPGANGTALLFGGAGLLANELAPALRRAGWTVRSLGSTECDIEDVDAVEAVIVGSGPRLVVNCAAYTQVDRAEADSEHAFGVNADGAGNVARAAAKCGAKLLHLSTDYAFDGALRRPYRETDSVSPLGVYAKSKVAGEQQVALARGRHYIVRTGELYGAGGRNFFGAVLERARQGAALRVVDDQIVAPTWTRELALQLALLVDHAPPGVYHATAEGEVSWFDAARAALRLAGIRAHVEPVSTSSRGSAAPRPPYSVLAHEALERLGLFRMRAWNVALAEWIGGRR